MKLIFYYYEKGDGVLNKKILSMCEPKINTFPIYGDVFSVLPVETDERLLSWVYNNFIQLRYLPSMHILFFEQYRSILDSCPYLSRVTVRREMIHKNYGGLHGFLREMIDMDQYVFLYVDRYFLPVYSAYQKKHINHEFFIYGYDEEKQIYYCSDNDQSGKYCRFTCTFEEVLAAYEGVMGSTYHTNVHAFGIEMWWSKEYEPLKEKQIFALLDDYVNSRDVRNFTEPFSNLRCGFGVHQDVLRDIETADNNLDVRSMYLLLEHKKLMAERFAYMYKETGRDVYEKVSLFYNDISENYNSLMIKMVKYNMRMKQSLLEIIVTDFKELIKQEKQYFETLNEIMKEFI